jgi:hypothetical protein
MMITQTIKHSLGLSLLIFCLFTSLTSQWQAVGIIVGTTWGCLNLYLIALLIKTLLITKKHFFMSMLLFIKFPLLYALGYQLLSSKFWNPWFIIAGFTLIFFPLILNTIRTRFNFVNHS